MTQCPVENAPGLAAHARAVHQKIPVEVVENLELLGIDRWKPHCGLGVVVNETPLIGLDHSQKGCMTSFGLQR